MIGTSVGQYECRRLLGAGGTGMVYLAVHRVLNTPRAVKILRSEWRRYPEQVGRFINEARAAAAIRHRNIIGVHDCGQLPDGDWFILLDYLEGGTLARFITSHGGPLAPHDVVHVLAEVANGLQTAHDHGIVHRDLKPDNIHLSHRDGDPRAATILDFGVAKLKEPSGEVTTAVGMLIGTPAYMAPEQLRGEHVGPAADVFALGVIAYQMVSGGMLPYQHEVEPRDYYRLTAVELHQRITSGPPIDLRRHNPSISPEWIQEIHAALDPDPQRRPPSPRTLALRLAEAIPGDGFSPSGVSLVRTYARELFEVGTAEATLRAPPSPPPNVRGPSRYQTLRLIGAGGMAEVFEGELIGAEGFARQIAIKKVRPELGRDPRFAEMFIAEARLASRLAHPNLVSVLDFDRDPEGRPFLVMEYVAGEDLAALLRRGRLPPPVAIFVATEMLHGLGYAHQLPHRDVRRGLIHCDLSPHNVLLSRQGTVKVSDFGIARALEDRGVVRSSMLSGKPAYMSPEQVHAQPLDARSDLFAVGIILWEMLTGQRLFTGSAREAMVKVLFKEIPPPDQLRPELRADLSAVVMKLLERDRRRRHASAQEAIEDLLACTDAPRDGRGALAQLLDGQQNEPKKDPKKDPKNAPGNDRLSELVSTHTREWEEGTSRGGLAGRGQLPSSDRHAQQGPTLKDRRDRRHWPWRWRPLVGLAAITGLGGAAVTTSALRGAGNGPGETAAEPANGSAGAGSEAARTAAPFAGAAAVRAGARQPSPSGEERSPAATAGASLRWADDAAHGVLVVAIRPWARIWVNGEPYGETPMHIKLPVGRHRVRIANHRASRTIAVSIAASRSTLLEGEL